MTGKDRRIIATLINVAVTIFLGMIMQLWVIGLMILLDLYHSELILALSSLFILSAAIIVVLSALLGQSPGAKILQLIENLGPLKNHRSF